MRPISIFVIFLVTFIMPSAHAQTPRPRLEIAVRGGPAFSPFLDGSIVGQTGFELFHIAPGLYTGIGVFSVFYSQQTDNYSCGPETTYSGNVDWSDLLSCEGKLQQAGSYYRLMSSSGAVHPWVGLGASWYKRAGNGTRRYHEGESSNPPVDYRFSKYEEGVLPFFLFGGEYAVTRRVSLGVDCQVGLFRFPLQEADWRGSGNLLPSNVGLRVSYKVY